MKLHSAENETIRLEIHGDECPWSPLEGDNLGTIVCWTKRHQLGDIQPGEQDPERWLLDWRAEQEGDVFVLPVYMVNHGGVELSTESFVGRAQHAEWDSCQVGWIVTTRKRADELGAAWESAEKQLRAEVKTYSQYISGDVYGFVVERKQECGHWDSDDSCWGFYGSDWAQNGLSDALAEDVRPLLEELS
jgi:hypothetical protein